MSPKIIIKTDESSEISWRTQLFRTDDKISESSLKGNKMNYHNTYVRMHLVKIVT